MALVQLLVMCVLLGAASFGLGLLPLACTLSKTRVAQVSTLGTGLLLGAAMGVVIPEGIETLTHASNSTSPDSKSNEVPTQTIALCLLSGFTLMLLIEQLLSSTHQHQPAPAITRATLFDEDDIEQLELGPAPGDQYPDPTLDPDPTPAPGGRMGRRSGSSSRQSSVDLGSKRGKNALGGESQNEKGGNPNAITFGLVVHSLADGLALGASARSGQNALEAVVFLAIIVHKAPTALALCTALMPHLPRQSVRRHVTAFALTSPLTALMTYFILDFLGDHSSLPKWTGIALLFSSYGRNLPDLYMRVE
ncbi:hypothetical protein FRC08_018739 [Ceratobasidium sp. 394]|nr:hypothetical protein FRC08_018739 [Ceratobasidium sp. 394]